MSFAALADRYGMDLPEHHPDQEESPRTHHGAEPHGEAPGELPPSLLGYRFDCWQDSLPVCDLSEYIARHKSLGLQVCQSKGVPVIEFEPGLAAPSLGAAATRRWNIGMQAADLLLDAASDLIEMLETGVITLPPAKK
jgi:hypothetical protein